MNTKEIEKFLEDAIRREEVSQGHYSVKFHSESFICKLSDKKLKEYAKVTAGIYTELKGLTDSGKITTQDFISDEDKILKMMAPFAEGGFLNTPLIQNSINELGWLRNINLGTAAWMLMYRPEICSVIYGVAEKIAEYHKEGQKLLVKIFKEELSEKDWILYLNYYLIRSFLKFEFADM